MDPAPRSAAGSRVVSIRTGSFSMRFPGDQGVPHCGGSMSFTKMSSHSRNRKPAEDLRNTVAASHTMAAKMGNCHVMWTIHAAHQIAKPFSAASGPIAVTSLSSRPPAQSV